MSLCASVYMCFVVTCWERTDLLALVCGVYYESKGPEKGSNSRPLDLQSDSHLLPDTLPTAIRGPVLVVVVVEVAAVAVA